MSYANPQSLPASVLVVLAMSALSACSAQRDSNGDRNPLVQMMRSASATDLDDASDPCTLLSAGEAAQFVGKLAIPPYRATDEAQASTSGTTCVYRGTDGRQIVIKPNAHGGAMAGNVMQSVPQALGSLLNNAGASGMGSMAGKIMQQEAAGPWDKATWIPGGSLFVTKGDAAVAVDVSGASGKQEDALAIAKMIVPRIAHPLSYNGALAVALVPRAPKHPSNPCDFVPRAAVESAIGQLSGAPTPDSAGASCTYRVATSQGLREYQVEFKWDGGESNYNTLKHSSSTMSSLVGAPTSSPLDTMKPTGQMGQMLGGLMKMVSGGNAANAPGASTKVGLQTDTTLKGPWDSAMLWHGTQLVAVRDVFVDIALQSADYDRAKTLLDAICRRL